MTIAVFCEDKYWEPFQILARKIVGEGGKLIFRHVKQGTLRTDDRKIAALVDLLRGTQDISKVIVCVDSECTPETTTRPKLKKIEKKVGSRVSVPVSYACVTHALEGWLLADPAAIEGFLGTRAQVKVSASETQECKPKERMKTIFRKAGRKYTPSTDNVAIAEKVDINTAAKNNKSFGRFRDELMGR